MTELDAHEVPALTTIIVGAGPGIGLSVARRFTRGGGAVGLIARSAEHLENLARTLAGEGIDVVWDAADATSPAQLRSALARLIERLGHVDVLCISPIPNIDLIRPVLETSADDFAAALALSVGCTATAVEAVVPAMLARGSGTVLVTSGSGARRPNPDRAASAVATSAQTAYVDVLREALAPRGIHVSQLVIVGPVGSGLKHEPDAVAERLWQRHESGTAALEVLDRPAVA